MICEKIQMLIDYSIKNKLIEPCDELVIRNQLMDALRVYDWEDVNLKSNNETIDNILNALTDFACENGVCEDTTASRDLFDTKLMGIVTPFPRELSIHLVSIIQTHPSRLPTGITT